jgi:Zn-dependent protease
MTRNNKRQTMNLTHGIPLGRIAGIRIRADWSLLVIFGLILATLGAGVFDLPGQPAWIAWTLASIATFLFYASLLAHELAHAIVARRQGTPVEDITLWLFGGAARLRGEPASPGAEARTTAAGLAVTGLLGVLFWALAEILQGMGASSVVAIVPTWLAFMNLLLGAFNAVPALPLDGGRLLHAGLWRWWGSRDRATVSAARLGRAFGFLIVAAGVLGFVVLGGFGGLWLALIGWFLMTAAGAEERQVQLSSVLQGLRVRDVMTASPNAIPAWITVEAFLHHVALAQRGSAYPVADISGRVVGVVSLRRVATVSPQQRGSVRLQEVAAGLDSSAVAAPGEPLIDVARRMRSGPGDGALVFDEGRLVGVVSVADIARAVQIASLQRRGRGGGGAFPYPVERPNS